MRLSTAQKAKLALSNRLFVNGWTLREELLSAVDYPNLYDIKLEYKQGMPVAVALLTKSDGLISMFVRKEWRRKGLGKKLVKRFGDKVKCAGYGVIGSEKFYRKLGIEMDRY